MNYAGPAELTIKGQAGKRSATDVIEISEEIKYIVILAYASLVLVSSFFFNTPSEIAQGLLLLVLDPSILLSDYIAIGNAGSAFFNSGFLMLISIFIAKLNKIHINGTIIAAVFTVGGFAFFGKNIYNVWPILLGVYLYSRVQGDQFDKYILVGLFGTALAPLVSQVSFGLQLPLMWGIILGNMLGVAAGFFLPPLAHHVIKFHQGYNIYNVGFTAGIVGTFLMSFFRSFGLEHEPVFIVARGHTNVFSFYLISMFISMVVIGYIFNNGSFSGYARISRRTGRLVTDFVTLDGFGLSFINMGLLGLVSTLYVLLLKGEINGPVIGGIFTIVGFAAFGKHLKNITPIFLGVYLASLVQIWDVTATGTILAALFGTTLAPIAGEFGWKTGVVAGFIHMAVVMNVGYLHGGMNLYNNGFAGGLVAGVLVPIIIALRKVT